MSYLYITVKRESGEHPIQKQKGASSQGKGVYHRRTHTPVTGEIDLCEPTPLGNPCCFPLLNLLVSSSSRFHWIGNKRSESNRNGLLWSTRYNVPIDVTNRTRQSINAVINNVNNYVRNYSLNLLHTQTTFTKGITPQHNITSKHIHIGKSKTKEIHIISRGIYGAS